MNSIETVKIDIKYGVRKGKKPQEPREKSFTEKRQSLSVNRI